MAWSGASINHQRSLGTHHQTDVHQGPGGIAGQHKIPPPSLLHGFARWFVMLRP